MAVNFVSFRSAIPIFRDRPTLAYLDNATAKLVPNQVMTAFNEPLKYNYLIARKGSHVHAIKATEMLENARTIVADWHGVNSSQVIFQPTLPMANLLLAETIHWKNSQPENNPDKKKTCFLLISPDTHNATVLSWLHAAKRWKWKWKILPLDFLDPTATTDVLKRTLEKINPGSTHIVLIASDVSMVLGWTPPLTTLTQIIKEMGGNVVLDVTRGYQYHDPKQRWKNIDYVVVNMGAALWMPHGLAMVIGKEKWPAFPPSFLGSGMVRRVTPEHFEVESPPMGLEPDTLSLPHVNALASALALLKKITPRNVRRHDDKLRKTALDLFWEQPALHQAYQIISEELQIEPQCQGILSFLHERIEPTDIVIFLEELHEVIVRSGNQCTQLLFNHLPQKNPNGQSEVIQASFSYHNTEEDVEKLMLGLKDASLTFSSS